MIIFKDRDKLTEADPKVATIATEPTINTVKSNQQPAKRPAVYDMNGNRLTLKQQQQRTKDEWAKKFDFNKKYVYTDPKTGKTFPIQFSTKDGHPFYYDGHNTTAQQPVVEEIKEAPAEQPQYTRTQIASANSQVLQMFKDGTEIKNILLNKTVPINDILIQNGNIIVENKHEETNRILESLNIKCPDYLLLKEAETINANGQTSLNSLFSDDVQQVLNATGKQITWIHNENGNVVLYDANKQNYTLDSIKQQAEQIAQKAKEEEAAKAKADEEAKQQAEQNSNVMPKMSKQEINLIATNVLNALNSKLGEWEGYKISWELIPSGFDAKSLRESVLNEDLRQAFTNLKNKVGAAFGTNSGRQNSMTNRSMPTTFAVKPTLVKDDEELTQDNKDYSTILKMLWNQASKILNNYTEIQPTDANGKQYKTKATFQLQPDVKDGVFVYKTVVDIKGGTNTSAQTQGQTGQQNQNIIQNNNGKNPTLNIQGPVKKIKTKTDKHGNVTTKIKYQKNRSGYKYPFTSGALGRRPAQ